MKRTVWYMYRDGDDRAFAMTRPPSSAWAEEQELQGYILVSFDIELPDPSAIRLGTQAVLSPYRRWAGPGKPMVVHTVETLSETLRDNYVRASGDCVCSACGATYHDHPADEVEDWLTVLCNGRRVKL